MNYFLAIDIGASSGRHILGYLKDDEIILEEVHRFKNAAKEVEDTLCWDIDYLFSEIIEGLKKCKDIGKIPKTLGIDTWGVDFVLLDDSDKIIGKAVSYRDKRTKGVMEDICNKMSVENIYNKTGIQFMEFNTIYQLKSLPLEDKKKAKHFLMIPDYINYLLTGKKVNEYTNATTTQLFNITENDWDKDLLKLVGLEKDVFSDPMPPLSNVGGLKKDIKDLVGFDCDVILPPTHDTGSAFLSSVLDIHENGVILSSGTWSLLGKELKEPKLCKKSLDFNFTNEGGYDKRYRYLKNIMGLWIIQEVARNLDYQYSFSELVDLAREAKSFPSTIDVNDNRFFSNKNMIEEIVEYCEQTGQKKPVTIGEISICVYRSLAKSYKKYIDELSEITGHKIDKINIIGGGCKNEFLNELIAQETNKEVIVGPIEATGIGNIITQMIATKELESITMAKKIIKNSI